MAVRCDLDAGQPRIPEQLRHGPLTVTELAGRSGAHPPTLARLLRTGATTGLLRTAGPGIYALTDIGQALLDGPEVLRVKWCALPEMWSALGELTETVRTGQAPFALRYGSTYGYLSGHPEAVAAFDASMVANHGDLATRLAGAGDFAGVRTLADIGGGRGAFLASIMRAHPGPAWHPAGP